MESSEMKIILFGGNRKDEDGPMMHFIKLLKQSGVGITVISDPIHLGMKLRKGTTLKEALEEESIEYLVCNKLDKELLSQFVDSNTVGVSFNSSWIFKKDIIDLFNGNLFNYHNARLPEEQGAAAYSWKILLANSSGELNFHKVEVGIDEGETVWSIQFDFPDSCNTCADFLRFMEEKEQVVFSDFLNLYLLDNSRGGHFKQEKKDASRLAYYWPRLDTNIHGFINWDWSHKEIQLFMNAFSKPHAGASSFYGGKRVHFHDVEILDNNHFHPFQAGLVFRKSDSEIFIAAKGGAVIVKTVLNEDGQNITVGIKLGRRFYTPVEYLERAKRVRMIFKGDTMEVKEF